MKKIFMFATLLFATIIAFSQNYATRTAHINVRSANNVQNIVADNYQVACQLNTQTGQFKLLGLIKSFQFQIGAVNRVMNTRQVDVTEYPKITYDGVIANLKDINFSKPGVYPVKFKGMIYVWDEKSPTEISGTLKVLSDGSIEANSNFTVAIAAIDAKKLDMIMRKKLPVSLNLQPNMLGISKDIQIKAEAKLKKQ